MTYHGKDVEVIITGDAKEFYEMLSTKINDELSKNIESSSSQALMKAITNKITLLKRDPSYGIQIPKDRIPKEYILKYDANNLWKINLSGYWRIIYTIQGKEIKIIALILDIFDHKEYNKKFHYKK
jgi:mRNA-degrading endonuclease RelE of RelBE toxin-antitoxin system